MVKSVIYYFTGTGNTLAVARDLATELGDARFIPLRQAMTPGGIIIEADVVGIAFPVYFLDLPEIVKDFVQQIRFTGSPYIFGIATCGERPGSALFNLRQLLEEKGSGLSAGFVFVIAGELYRTPLTSWGMPVAVRKNMLQKKAGSRHSQRQYGRRRSRCLKVQIQPCSILEARLTRTLATSVYGIPRRFHATAKCNTCRTCERICPTRNITVGTNTVIWGNTCTQCYACIHWCPTGAIEIGGRTTGKPRYHHPDVTVRDMLIQRGEPR